MGNRCQWGRQISVDNNANWVSQTFATPDCWLSWLKSDACSGVVGIATPSTDELLPALWADLWFGTKLNMTSANGKGGKYRPVLL